LDEAVDFREILRETIFHFSSESHVVGDCPFHFLSAEFGYLTVWPENLAVKVVEVSDDNSVFEMNSINFSVWAWVF